MATHNDITGDALVSKRNNDNYRNNYDAIFGKKKGAAAEVAVSSSSQELLDGTEMLPDSKASQAVDTQVAADVECAHN